MKSTRSFCASILVGGLLFATIPASAQSLSTNQTWHYRLLNPSTLTDDCFACDRLSPTLAMRGGFDVVLLAQNPITTRYGLTNIDFTAQLPGGPSYHVTGQGTWEIGGEVAVIQTVKVQATIDGLGGSQTRSFTNVSQQVVILWPDLQVDLNDTSGLFDVFRLHVTAAPLLEIWFSTAAGFMPGVAGQAVVTSGDIVSDAGRVVKRQADLVQALGLPPGSYALDALDIAPGGSVLFSLNQDVASPALGLLHNGDLFSERGALVASNQALLSAFGLTPPVPDLGLKGVQVRDGPETLFTISKDTTIPTAAGAQGSGMVLTHGDLLSSYGQILKQNKQLLANFQPGTNLNFGLKAFHVWPSGEVWFSVETGFTDARLGDIGTGDLLSDQGFIVFRNIELLAALQPLEKPTSFGLTSLFVVSDVTTPPSSPKLLTPVANPPGGGFALKWSGPGRVFQVQKTTDLTVLLAPASPIVPGSIWTDPGAMATNASAFYRLRQW